MELAAAVVLVVPVEVSFGPQDRSQLWGGSSGVTALGGPGARGAGGAQEVRFFLSSHQSKEKSSFALRIPGPFCWVAFSPPVKCCCSEGCS